MYLISVRAWVGPSRYLAAEYGCRVHGVDLNHSRVESANNLTALVGLTEQVAFSQDDVCHLDFRDQAFDRAISQEGFLHVSDKEQLLAESFRVLRPGGGLGFTDWTASDSLTPRHRQHFATTFAAERILSVGEYIDVLSAAGFVDVEVVDLSAPWREILRKRLEMFRSLEAGTVARFGQARHDTYMENYTFFVERIDVGDLGGARFVGWVPAGGTIE